MAIEQECDVETALSIADHGLSTDRLLPLHRRSTISCGPRLRPTKNKHGPAEEALDRVHLRRAVLAGHRAQEALRKQPGKVWLFHLEE